MMLQGLGYAQYIRIDWRREQADDICTASPISL